MSETARRLVFLLLLIGMAAVGAELSLLSHHEDWRQAIPLALLAVGAATLPAAAIRPSAGALRAWRVVACLFIAGGLAGVSLHLQASIEFQREMHPSLRRSRSPGKRYAPRPRQRWRPGRWRNWVCSG